MPLKIWTRREITKENDSFNERKDGMSFKFIAKNIIKRQKYGKDAILVVIFQSYISQILTVPNLLM